MGYSINQISLLGNVGQNPEIKYLPSGAAVINFSLATSEKWKDKTTGEEKERTDWHRCQAFGPLAELLGKLLHKGAKVFISGQQRHRSYEKDGETRYVAEVHVRDFVLCDGNRREGDAQPPGATNGGTRSPKAGERGYNGADEAKRYGEAVGAGKELDEDIPF